ncbi:MAG: DNA helicase-2/ATP-dependent DNA helicase PcrA [Bradymonadia bacterium]
MSLDDLNPAQRAAVEHADGPLLILAGAGSGKTRVITTRIARLIREGSLPSSILAVTFTNKAAREMRARASKLVGPEAQYVTISTFHSACARILRGNPHIVGLTRSFTIYDPDDSLVLLRELAEKLDQPHDASAVRAQRTLIEGFKSKAMRPHDVHTMARSDDEEQTANLFEAYQATLHTANACDFGDLIAHVVHGLEDDEQFAGYIRHRYQHLLVDEFQDTNVAQYKLIRLLTPDTGDIAVVGDDDQAIYAWRGATVENVRHFQDDNQPCKVIALEQNYRSGPVILEAANALVEKLASRLPKTLRTDREDREKIEVFIGRDDRDEADFIIREIQRLRGELSLKYSDFAVLFRVNSQSRVLEERFRAAGVRHVLRGGLGWFDRKEVKDALAYLRLAANPSDEVAFRRIANVPARGIGKTSLRKVIALRDDVTGLPFAAALRDTADKARLQAKTREGMRELADLLESLSQLAGLATAAEVLEAVITDTDYEGYLVQSDDINGEERVQNVRDLLESTREFCDTEEDTSVIAFLEATTLTTSQDVADDESTVQMMTMHAAKGLEFPVVFATGFEEKQFPMERMNSSDEEEERRLCYVAFTRAMRRLYVSAAQRRRLFGKTRENRPSIFLTELPEALIQFSPTSSSKSLDWSSRREQDVRRRKGKPDWDEFDQRPWQERHAEVPEGGIIFTDENFEEIGAPKSASRLIGKTGRSKMFGDGLVIAVEESSAKTVLTIEFPTVGIKKIVSKFVDIVD